MTYTLRKKRSAFTLIELSVVLVIISILLATSMPIAKGVIENYRINITNKRIQALYQALGNFTKNYKRLPCPASMLLAKGNVDYGKEVNCGSIPYPAGSYPAANSGIWQCAWSNNIIYGMIPAQALGLPDEMAEDGFGNKLAYIVIRGYTNSSTFGTDDPSTYDYNNYTGQTYNWKTNNRFHIHDKFGSTYIDSSAANGIFVIISYGANKYGAFPANGTTQDVSSFSASGFPAAFSDEGFNMLRYDNMGSSYAGPTGWFYNYGLSGSDFYYPFLASSNNSTFDDIVFYKSREQMVNDFDLQDIVTCSYHVTQDITYGSSSTYYWNGSSGNLLNTKYGNVVASSGTDCPTSYRRDSSKPTKRCGRFGIWESDIINPCKQ
jgi:prepilin-type N-terminal cleavage/methylation domain-containing protein